MILFSVLISWWLHSSICRYRWSESRTLYSATSEGRQQRSEMDQHQVAVVEDPCRVATLLADLTEVVDLPMELTLV